MDIYPDSRSRIYTHARTFGYQLGQYRIFVCKLQVVYLKCINKFLTNVLNCQTFIPRVPLVRQQLLNFNPDGVKLGRLKYFKRCKF